MSKYKLKLYLIAGFHTMASNVEYFKMQRGILNAISKAGKQLISIDYNSTSKSALCTIEFEANDSHDANIKASEIATLIDLQDDKGMRTFEIQRFEVL